jgi:mono/diheme cytochrome c family protein
MRRSAITALTVVVALAAALPPARALGAEPAPAPAPGAKVVDFTRDIKPILNASCLECHNAKKTKGSLRLDAKALAMKGGTTGPSIVPGNGKDSYLVHRLRGMGDEDQMPLKKDPLSEGQIQLITTWIDQGANWPDDAAGTVAETKHWSFVKPDRPEEPAVKDAAWSRNAIDRFILARLEKEGLKPSREAPKETLLRRVSLDLTGLPPTPAEIDAFLADASPDAYEKQVERLLASKHYAERWAQHWLDAARYADSNGYSHDNPRTIWKYRDWVIDAVGRNMPYDQFVTEQLAGDMLPDATVEQKIATGFHRNTQINTEGGIDPEQFRIEAVFDRVGTTSTVFLGLTVACAQCHNHKFDPISQKDYYRLFAFFNNQDEPTLQLAGSPEDEKNNKRIAQLESAMKKAEAGFAKWEASLTDEQKAQLPPEAQAAVMVEPGSRSKGQKAAVLVAYAKTDAKYERWTNELADLRQKTAPSVTTMVMAERKEPRTSSVFIKGDFTRPGDPVTPGTLTVLHPLKDVGGSYATRLDLTQWITDPENPLTARVTVNRVWQQYFGKGLVETENDFGTQGTPPTHPDLLDWLATEFMRQKWSMKAMHRLIVNSATYRQASELRADLAAKDPYNKLLGRQSRLRLDAEIVRDVALVASGLFSDKVGGPSVFPPQPEGATSVGQVKHDWKVSTGEDRYRRGMYTFYFRASLHPLLNSFDAPDRTSTCTRRLRSNTPLQALTLLNDEAFFEFAQALAVRVLKEAQGDDAARIEHAFRRCLARKPTAEESQVLTRLLQKQRGAFQKAPAEAKAVAGEKCPKEVHVTDFAAWTVVSRGILNLDETITRE